MSPRVRTRQGEVTAELAWSGSGSRSEITPAVGRTVHYPPPPQVESLANLAELPESTAILVLDQFMLSGAEEEYDKGAYLTSLISKIARKGLDAAAHDQQSMKGLGHVKRRVSSGGKYVSVNLGPVRVVSREQDY
ncbi:hypothetical protein HanHA300_Chr03g0092771 [Helianthus annuus]|nr:hypothetical protein HanHA300_Chr03g0092771 [Helianthus annuus]KAJ0773909.1 hypothetical protein HanOQP8_Chr03g0105651 [Helianthus annuus]